MDNKTLITGSFYWSPSAAQTNDETLLVIHSPHSPNTSPVIWSASGTQQSSGSHRTSNANSSLNGSAAEMGGRGTEKVERDGKWLKKLLTMFEDDK